MTYDDVPKPLTRLIRLIMRGFYNIEHKLIVDMLVRRRETKEDDLVDVLKLERKHLRSLLQQMRQDKFINIRLIMETDEDGKSTRRNYYSINYRMFVNVVKYKLEHVRKKLETDHSHLTGRASFKCQSCRKNFSDLELTDLSLDPISHLFKCSFCEGVVDEDPDVRPKEDSRLVIAKFNDQMKPIYELLKETESIGWSINEADRNNIIAGAASAGGANNNSNNNNNPTLGLNNTGSGLANGSSAGDLQNLGQSIVSNPQEQQYPVTITGLDESSKQLPQPGQQQAKTLGAIKINPEIEALLLREESLANSNTNGTVQGDPHDEDGNTVMMMTTDDECTFMIPVGQTCVPIDKISEEHIELMNPEQRVNYVRLMRFIYNLVFG